MIDREAEGKREERMTVMCRRKNRKNNDRQRDLYIG
jgi:hypothetical protein